MKKFQIAIDGPSGVGKSTLAKSLSNELGFVYVDTGALYRAVGLFAQENGIDPNDEEGLSLRFKDIDIRLVWTIEGQRVLLCGRDVSSEIRTPKSSMYASAVSALPSVRTFLLDLQRSIARENSVIMDGRDIGTVILPNADVKIFMSADENARAKRRYEELLLKGQSVTLEDVLSDMQKRDHDDSTRKTAPLRPADDAIMLDNSGMEPEETLAAALKIIKEHIVI